MTTCAKIHIFYTSNGVFKTHMHHWGNTMNATQLWEAVCQLLELDMSAVSYKTWVVAAIKPVEINGDHLVLEIASDFNRRNLQSRYGALL